MEQKEAQGKNIDVSDYYLQTSEEIKSLSDKVAAADLQLQYLLSVQEHNVMASEMVEKMPGKDMFIEALDGIKEFHSNAELLQEEDPVDVDQLEYDNQKVLDFTQINDMFARMEERFLKGLLTLGQVKQLNEKDITDDIYVARRNGLNYAKLYLNKDGGYDLDQLTTALKKMASDFAEKKDPRVPFIEGVANEERLKDLLRGRMAQNPGEEEEEAAEVLLRWI